MKPIKTYIHRILFRLGFCRKEAKKILEFAANSKNYYMCHRVGEALHYHIRYMCMNDAPLMSAYGFTRKNYHKFVKENYPDLVYYLRIDGPYWIIPITKDINAPYIIIEKSKTEFLKHLADKL